MDITEAQIDRWLERGSKFFKATSCNPVVRGRFLPDPRLDTQPLKVPAGSFLADSLGEPFWRTESRL